MPIPASEGTLYFVIEWILSFRSDTEVLNLSGIDWCVLCLSFLSLHIDIEFFWCCLLEMLSLCIFVSFIKNHWAIAVQTFILPAVLYPYSTCLFWASTMLFVLLCLCSIWKHVGSLSKIFCASIEMIMWYFCFILWSIYWVVCIEQSAFWGWSQLVCDGWFP